jgi:L-asparaginase II
MQVGRGDWVTKVGADGVQAVGSASRGQAFAMKVIDGNKTALFAAAVEVMDQLGWLDERQREELRPWRAAEIASVRGATVGERKPGFRLQVR